MVLDLADRTLNTVLSSKLKGLLLEFCEARGWLDSLDCGMGAFSSSNKVKFDLAVDGFALVLHLCVSQMLVSFLDNFKVIDQ